MSQSDEDQQESPVEPTHSVRGYVIAGTPDAPTVFAWRSTNKECLISSRIASRLTNGVRAGPMPSPSGCGSR